MFGVLIGMQQAVSDVTSNEWITMRDFAAALGRAAACHVTFNESNTVERFFAPAAAAAAAAAAVCFLATVCFSRRSSPLFVQLITTIPPTRFPRSSSVCIMF
jgi:hypothetical protein